MAKADSVHSTPRRTASLRKATKRRSPPPSARPVADPIFAAIDKHQKLVRAVNALSDALERAELKAKKKYGRRPWSLVAWRNYSAIGGSEIEARREEFLKLPGIDPKKIEKESRSIRSSGRLPHGAKHRCVERRWRDG
jgi:hypothetical protein